MIKFNAIKDIIQKKGKKLVAATFFAVLFSFFLLYFSAKSFSLKNKKPVEHPPSSSSVLEEKQLYFERKADSFLNYRPKIEVYNLYFEKSRENHSIGEDIYKEMMNLDSKYLANILDEAGETPEKVAKSLGIKRSRIMGKYNPAVQGENGDPAASYPIPYFKNIHYRFINGDGVEIDDASNVKDILAFASVYTYKHNYLDTEHFLAICRELYDKSHSYTLSISPVYFDQGCVNLSAKEEAEQEEGGTKNVSAGTKDNAKESSEMLKEGEVESIEKEKESSSRTDEDIEESGDSRDSGESGESDAIKQDKIKLDNNTNSEEPFSTSSSVINKKEGSEEEQKKESFEKNSSGGSADFTATTTKNPGLAKNYCPGHVDLTITIQVKKFSDQNGLKEIVLESLEKDIEWEQSPFSRWKGWNEECITAVNSLIEKDWFTEYGLSLSTVETKIPLSEEEISRYMSLIPEGLSEERKKLIHFALEAVGKVPYYYGGKATKRGFEGNNFGKTSGQRDYKGRNKKGLDCSGFIQWAYWSGVDNPLNFVSSTKELVGMGNKIKRSDLIPGDLIIQPSGESHVVMFLTWTEEGKMLAIHENSTAGTVSVDEVSANYPYYRSLLP